MSNHRLCPDCGYIDPSPKEDYEARIAELEAENDLIAREFQEANNRFRVRIAELDAEVKRLRPVAAAASRISKDSARATNWFKLDESLKAAGYLGGGA